MVTDSASERTPEERPDARRRVQTYELSSELRVAVGRLSRRIRAEKADDELSDGQFSVLALLFREGPRTLGELSEHERVTPPSMNRRVGHLVAAGYVERGPAPDDGRKVVLRATEAGAELVKETRRRRDAWLYQRLANLPTGQRHLLMDAARVIRELADS
jgi:DNA-binding MarR family transcriptional regulator